MTAPHNLFFPDAPGDIVAGRERSHERDLAVYGLLGAVTAIVSGAKFPTAFSPEFRLGQLAGALADAEARMAKAEAQYEADMAAWRATLSAEALADPQNDVRSI